MTDFLNIYFYKINIRTASDHINSEKIERVRIALKIYEVVLEKIIYISNLRFNIVSTEQLKEDSYIKYSNFILYCLYDGVTEETLVKTDNLLEILVIIIN